MVGSAIAAPKGQTVLPFRLFSEPRIIADVTDDTDTSSCSCYLSKPYLSVVTFGVLINLFQTSRFSPKLTNRPISSL